MDAAHSFSRRKSEAGRLVEGFQELNERLSAFERLAQLKRMVLEGKLKQEVFEEMYRINTEKLVQRQRRKTHSSRGAFEVGSISVLEDFLVRHRTQQPSSSLADLTAVNNSRPKRGTLYFDRIVLRAVSAFGSTKETILIGTQEMTLVFYDDEVRRVDLVFENKRQEQFVFETEVEKLMFVEALEKALDTAARASTSKDEPVLLGRPLRTNSQIKRELEARKNACMKLEQQLQSSNQENRASGNPLSKHSFQSFRSNVTSTYTDDVHEFDEEDEDEFLDRQQSNEEDSEEKADEEDEPLHGERIIIESTSKLLPDSAPSSPVLSRTDTPGSFLSSYQRSASSGSTSLATESSTSSLAINTEAERSRLVARLQDAQRERVLAEQALQQEKLAAQEMRRRENEQQDILRRIKAAEDEAVKQAVEAREEDVKAAKLLAECVANEIAALNALDPDDVLSSTTNRNGDEPEVFMSNDLRALIGQPLSESAQAQLAPHAKLQYSLQQARRALAAARVKVEKTAENRRVAESGRREARRAVSAQMSACSDALREVTRAESAVLKAKAVLTEKEERVAHYEQCLLILDEHRKVHSSNPKPTSHAKSNFIEVQVAADQSTRTILDESAIIT